MNNEPAVIVKELNKTFKLPRESHSGIKQALVGLFRGQKGYETQKVLTDISFEIKKGEFFGIVGRNGSGKSTLLKLLAGIYAPDSGYVKVNGSLTPFIELGVGFNPELTGRENVFMNGALLGFDHGQMEVMYDDIVEFAELEKFMDQKLKNYSSGMQVRLAFSIAIRADGDILLLDEVLAVGDENFQQKCLDVFHEYKKQKKTTILVTHSMDHVEKFCDRVLLIVDGEIKGVYPTHEAIMLYKKLNISGNEVQTSDVDDLKRRGARELEIKNISILDENGSSIKKPSFKTGDAFRVAIDIKRNDNGLNIDKFAVGLSFSDSERVNLAGPNSLKEDFSLSGNGTRVLYSFKDIRFNSNKLFLTVGVFDEFGEKTYDYWEEAIAFDMISQANGKFIIDGKWEKTDNA